MLSRLVITFLQLFKFFFNLGFFFVVYVHLDAVNFTSSFIYFIFWLHSGAQTLGTWTSVAAALRLSSCGLLALGQAGFSSCDTWAHFSTTSGIFPDQESNPWPLHWQVDP